MDGHILLAQIQSKQARIGIIGLGYVGLPLAILAASKGFTVTGMGRSEEKVRKLQNGQTNVDTIDKALLLHVLKTGRFKPAVLSSAQLRIQDVLIICVPTPVTHAKKPDLRMMQSVARALLNSKGRGQLIINESTVAPGTTRQLFGSYSGYVACSPERVDPGNKDKELAKIPKVVGGLDVESQRLAQVFYEQILQAQVISVSSLEAAEMAKMFENTYRAVNIALSNEMSLLAEKIGIDILEVIRAASTKWSFQAHYPGIGVGGHCIPVDPYYLLELSRKTHTPLRVTQAALSQNAAMPQELFNKLRAIYKKGMNIVIYGITYKKDVSDIRESPVLVFCDFLAKDQIPFQVYDPYIDQGKLESLNLHAATKRKVDIFIVGTDHSTLSDDYTFFVSAHTIVLDGRNAFTKKVGSHVIGIGRMVS